MNRGICKKLLVIVLVSALLWVAPYYEYVLGVFEKAVELRVDCRDFNASKLGYERHLELDTEQWLIPMSALGESMWWGEAFCRDINTHRYWHRKMQKEIEFQMQNPLSPRPAAYEGAVELVSMQERPQVAAFWRQDEDGVHRVRRIEAIDSPEDVALPEEVRTLMWLRVNRFTMTRELQDSAVSTQRTTLRLSFFHPDEQDKYHHTPMRNDKLVELWQKELGMDGESFPGRRVKCSLRIEVRKSVPPRLLEMYMNGVPYDEAVEQIRSEEFEWLPERGRRR